MKSIAQLCEIVQNELSDKNRIRLQFELDCRFKISDNNGYFIPQDILNRIENRKLKEKQIFDRKIYLLNKLKDILLINKKDQR